MGGGEFSSRHAVNVKPPGTVLTLPPEQAFPRPGASPELVDMNWAELRGALACSARGLLGGAPAAAAAVAAHSSMLAPTLPPKPSVDQLPPKPPLQPADANAAAGHLPAQRSESASALFALPRWSDSAWNS